MLISNPMDRQLILYLPIIRYFNDFSSLTFKIMKTHDFLRIIFLIVLSLLFSNLVFSQNAEQTVSEAANSINKKIDALHQMAGQKQIYKAIDKLDEINKEFNQEITWSTFDEKYKEAKMSNPSFDYQIREDLPSQLEPAFWANYEERCDRILADQDVAIRGMASMVQLNKFDQAMSYGSQLKTMYETIKGGIENLSSGNLPKFAYDLYGNMNDFIDNYTKIEDAVREGIEIETFKIEFNKMMTRSRINKDLYNDYKRYIQSNQIVINDFKANIAYIKKLKTAASTGPYLPLSYADRKYNWDYGPFQKDVVEACEEMVSYETKCEKLKSNVESIKSEARRDWTQIKGNIYASDDTDKKQEFITYHDERWTEFLQIADAKYQEAYQIYCLDNTASTQTNSSNPFDGSSAKGSAVVTPKNQSEEANNDQVNVDTESQENLEADSSEEEQVPDSSQENVPSENSSQANSSNSPKPSGAILAGTTYTTGTGQGNYCGYEIAKLRSNDQIKFVKVSGTLDYVQVIWRTNSGVWYTKYQGNRTEFTAGEFFENITPNITHLNFIVNSNHNRWSSDSKACKMEIYIIPTGGSNASPSEATVETKPNPSPKPNVQPKPQPTTPPNVTPTIRPEQPQPNVKLKQEFDDLIRKANEEFNKNYWEDGNSSGSTSSSPSNPKQKSLDLLRQAERLINRESDVIQRYRMVEQLTSNCSRFAQRVFAYSAKAAFIEFGCSVAGKAGGTVSSIQASGSQSKSEIQKQVYGILANTWRNLTGAATVGNHQYNKGYCDEQYKRFLELSKR